MNNEELNNIKNKVLALANTSEMSYAISGLAGNSTAADMFIGASFAFYYVADIIEGNKLCNFGEKLLELAECKENHI